MPRPQKPPASPARALARVKLRRERLLLREEERAARLRDQRRRDEAVRAEQARFDRLSAALGQATEGAATRAAASRLSPAGQAGRVATRIDHQLRRGDFAPGNELEA